MDVCELVRAVGRGDWEEDGSTNDLFLTTLCLFHKA